ncbi:WD40 repeat-containing protein [Leptolyngbya sp. PCC 7375]|nr:WD40 repeat-containing protein [Leptolyngbya sp. PCC 7375]
MSDYRYQVGGSLTYDSPSYVVRLADTELHDALQDREFCYVLTSRQMGKSSLLVQMLHLLQDQGNRCVTLDMTRLGSENLTPQQWYKGVMTELWDRFDLPTDLQTWWREMDDLPMPQRLSRFVEVLLSHVSDNIVIFIDETDSILSLNFPVDDFFAWIRFCYNQRALQPEYRRLTFGLFGVITPSDLIQDRHRTPFNIGKAIHLQGFRLEEAQILAQGLGNHIHHPQAVLQAILSWTNGQPFLTQKLCYLMKTLSSDSDRLTAETEVNWVDEVVRSHLIQDWQTQDEPEHLRTIRDRITRNNQQTGRLLALYQKVLQTPGTISSQATPEETELLLSGLITKRRGTLQVKNPIYANVFNLTWVNTQLAALRPYSQALDAWIQSSRQDASRLLGGQALQDALAWAKDKSLSNEDYQFLASSTEHDRQQTQQTLEISRLTEVKRNARLQKILLGAISLALLGAIGFGTIVWRQNRALVLGKIEALVATSEALRESEQNLAALSTAIKANQQLSSLQKTETTLSHNVRSALRRAVYKIAHYNTLSGHQADIRTAIFSPDDQLIATASVDGTAKLWQRDGTLITTLQGHTAAVSVIAFSPDGQTLATASEDGTAKLWQRDGTLITTLKEHSSSVWDVNFSPDGRTLATASGDSTVKLWQYDGTLVNTINNQAVAFNAVFSPDGQLLATTSSDSTVKLWQADGTLITSLQNQENSRTMNVVFSPDGRTLATANNDGMIRLWQDNTLIKQFKAHQAAIHNVAFSPDGNTLASASGDKTIKLWNLDGTLITTFEGHSAQIFDVRFSPDGETLLTGSVDKTAKLWQVNSSLAETFNGQAGALLSVVFSPDGKIIATTSEDGSVKLWRRDKTLITTLTGHQGPIWQIVFSPDGKTLASVSEDSTLKLWQADGTLVKTLTKHQGGVWGVAFSPDGQTLASAGGDNMVKLWHADGTFLKTLEGHRAPVWSVMFNPNGRTLATTSGDATAKLWNQDGKVITTFDNDGIILFDIAFSPDGHTLVTGGSDGIVKLWQADGTLLNTMVGHGAAVFQVAFSPNGETIATASVDNTVKLWHADGKLITSLEKHEAGVRGVSISPDGQTIATASDDKTVILWKLDQVQTLDLLNYGCNWIQDYLRTNAEVEKRDRTQCDGATQ